MNKVARNIVIDVEIIIQLIWNTSFLGIYTSYRYLIFVKGSIQKDFTIIWMDYLN